VSWQSLEPVGAEEAALADSVQDGRAPASVARRSSRDDGGAVLDRVLRWIRTAAASASAAPVVGRSEPPRKTPPTEVGGVQERTTCLTCRPPRRPALGPAAVTRCSARWRTRCCSSADWRRS